MVAQQVEVEAKFIWPSNLAIEALEEILRKSGFIVSWQPQVKQVDDYLDTPDYMLFNPESCVKTIRLSF